MREGFCRTPFPESFLLGFGIRDYLGKDALRVLRF